MRFYTFLFLSVLVFIISCSGLRESESLLFKNKVEAFVLLERYHHELHIMIGEDYDDMFEDGHDTISPDEAFAIFNEAVLDVHNPELIPIKKALYRIDTFSVGSDRVMLLDELVDRYQVGLQLQIEGILLGYGAEYPSRSDELLELYNRVSGGGV